MSTETRDSFASSSGTNNPPGRATGGRRESPWVWAAFGALLLLYVFSTLRVGPVGAFGTVLDDAVYFSSAKALATGQGYILPNFPFRFPATKYPELYPLLLSGVWKVNPHFPSNVNIAVAITLFFGCAALLFAFLLLRRWPGMDDWQALAVVALCALTGYFLDLSASIMTDVPSMSLMLGAIWMAECSIDRARKTGYWALGAGILGGFSVGFRTLDVAVIAGIGLVLLVKHEFRKLSCFSLAAAPLSLFFLWPALSAIVHPSGTQLTVGPNGSGWTQTLCYYTSYACNWRLDASGPGALKTIVLTNLKGVIEQPGMYLLSPLATRDSLWSLVLVTLVSVAAYTGVVRYIRGAGWQPLPITFLLFMLVVVPWPYTPDRFLITFLPLFFGGLWIEGRHFTTLVATHLRTSRSFSERMIACVLAAGGLALAITVAVNYAYAVPAKVARLARGNEILLQDERAAYAWIRENTGPNSSLVSVRDGLAYLYTGHPSVAPIDCLTQAFYQNDRRYAEHDAAHLADVARHIGASYWLTTREDFHLDGELDYTILQRRQQQLLANVPIVYQSVDGNVVLYDVRCLNENSANGCEAKSSDVRVGSYQSAIAPRPVSNEGSDPTNPNLD